LNSSFHAIILNFYTCLLFPFTPARCFIHAGAATITPVRYIHPPLSATSFHPRPLFPSAQADFHPWENLSEPGRKTGPAAILAILVHPPNLIANP
jgi:hypothetical protein